MRTRNKAVWVVTQCGLVSGHHRLDRPGHLQGVNEILTYFTHISSDMNKLQHRSHAQKFTV